MNSNESLNRLFRDNSISLEKINELVYNSLMLNFFKTIIIQLEIDGKKKSVIKERLKHSSNTKHLVYKSLIKEHINLNLSESEILNLSEWLKAYLNKSEFRNPFSNTFKKNRLDAQSNCCICDVELTISNLHIDHIIPFKYVGDELNDKGNLQNLCSKCNLEKGDSIDYPYTSYIRKMSKT